MGFFSQRELSGFGGCFMCGLDQTCEHPKMPVSGKGERGVLIVAEAPGETEDRKNTQLIGKAGQYLRDVLKDNGISLDRDCWKTNAVICRPPANRKPTGTEIDACRRNLFKVIKDKNPRVIVTLGSVALQAVIGPVWKEPKLGPMARWTGWKIPSKEWDCWICPTYHPSYLLRMEGSPTHDVLELELVNNLMDAFELENRPVFEDWLGQVDVLYSYQDIAAAIGDFVRAGETVAFDYETNCLRPETPASRVYSMSIASKNRCVAFPYMLDMKKLVRMFLKSTLPKVAANLQFEERWSRYHFDTAVAEWEWDTMVASRVLDDKDDTNGLKFQVFVNFGVGDYSSEIEPLLKAKGNDLNRVDEIPLQKLLTYNALDSYYELRLARKQVERLGIAARI